MTIKRVIDAILQKISVILLVTVIFGAVGAYIYYFIAEPEYTATTTFYVLNSSQYNAKDETVEYTDLRVSDMLVQDYNVLATSRSVKQQVASNLGLSSLAGYSISVASVETSRVIKIMVVNKDPAMAASVANELVLVFSEEVKDIMNVENVNVIDTATVPTSESGPARARNTFIAALAGLLLSTAVIVLRELLDNSVRTAQDIEELFNLPVLAQIPRLRTSSSKQNNSKKKEPQNEAAKQG